MTAVASGPHQREARTLENFCQACIELAVTLNSAPHHASNRQANTLQSGTLSRS